MHLYSPERPEISPNVKAILTDGSAMPVIVCQMRPGGKVNVSCLLRTYDNSEAYSYTYKSAVLYYAGLVAFFRHYETDPEDCFFIYFGWKPQAMGRRTHSTNASTKPKVLVKPSDDFNDALDLI